MRKLISITLQGILLIAMIHAFGVSEAYKETVYERMEIDKMSERLKPTILPIPGEIYDIAGIDIPNTVAIKNGKGEIALLSFDEKMRSKVEVPVPGFPGGGMLYTDPEHKFVWTRRGSGTYFLDTQTKQTGHCVSMFMGSKVYQVILADPEEKVWLIVYGQMGGNLIDVFNLATDTKKTLEGAIGGLVYSFDSKRVLVNSENKHNKKDWVFTSTLITDFKNPEEFELTKKMTELEIRLDYELKKYSLRSRFMIGRTSRILNPISKDSDTQVTIRWNEEGKTTITPLTLLQQPKEIRGLPFIGEFSSDGNWLDAAGRYVFNGINSPLERFVYHVGDQYPTGMSPPIRLGLVESNVKGAFMLHDTLGPCYILLDPENAKNVLLYKLNEGLPIIARQMAD